MNTLVRKYGNQKRWVNWIAEERDGKMTKVPLGKSDDRKTWRTYDEVKDNGPVGLMFGLKKTMLGIDIDHCLIDGKLSGDRSVEIASLLTAANSYCEISPSGTGLHVYFDMDEPFELKASRKHGFPYELYTCKRYFTVTQRPFGMEKDVRKISVAEAEQLLSIIGYPWKEEQKQTVRPEKRFDGDDKELLQLMFKGKNGAKIKKLHDGNTDDYGNDDSAADMAFLSHLAFYTQGDIERMQSLWLASPLGQRPKTVERLDYRIRSIQKAVDNCTEFYKPSKKTTVQKEDGTPFSIDELDLYFKLDKDGNRIYSLVQENINIVLAKHPSFKGRFRYDEFLIAVEIKINGIWEIQKDAHELVVQSEISTVLPMFNRVSPMMVQRGIAKVAHDNSFDSAKEYVKSLAWDKQSRIDQWLQIAFGIEDTEYTKTVGSNWLKGLVDRLLHPGCQFDYILVVEGRQGMKKSSAFRELVRGEWHLETERSPGEKDFFVEMAGKAVIELSEGQSNAMIDVKKMKSIITKRKDTYRSPYARIAEDHPRRSVFCMTTNDDDYLKDTTGDRRWLPVEATKIADVKWIRENRDQLFAEAVYRLEEGKETTYEFPEDVALEKQEERRKKDPNTDVIVKWWNQKCSYYERKHGVTLLDVFIGALCAGVAPANLTISRPQEMSISSVLKTTLKLKKFREGGGMRLYRYCDPAMENAPELLDLPIEKQAEIKEKEKQLDFFEERGF